PTTSRPSPPRWASRFEDCCRGLGQQIDVIDTKRERLCQCARLGHRRLVKIGALAIDLFHDIHEANLRQAQPLAARMRPRSVEEFAGQDHFRGSEKLPRRMLDADRLSSVIFYGPPGSGKTALAHVIAQHTQCRFVPLTAVGAGVKEARELLEEARHELET